MAWSGPMTVDLGRARVVAASSMQPTWVTAFLSSSWLFHEAHRSMILNPQRAGNKPFEEPTNQSNGVLLPPQIHALTPSTPSLGHLQPHV